MIPVFPILYVGWKLVHKTRIYKPSEVDLQKDMAGIDEYERNFIPQPPKYVPLHLSAHTRLTDLLRRNVFEKVLDKLFG